jgi:hypothetical protein
MEQKDEVKNNDDGTQATTHSTMHPHTKDQMFDSWIFSLKFDLNHPFSMKFKR